MMELLTIQSFIEHGYTFNLWTYAPLRTRLPESCVCHDANDIIPQHKVFKYKYASQFRIGKGSYAGFSDIFRYKVLFERGGWWVDMDVTCLKPFDVDAPYFFRAHHHLSLVGNIMKAPRGSELMLKCYKEASSELNEDNRDWHRPIEILVNNVLQFDLQKHVMPGIANSDEWHIVRKLIHSNGALPASWRFIHWCNEGWRFRGYDRNRPLYASTYGELLLRHGLIEELPERKRKQHDRAVRCRSAVDRITAFFASSR